MYIAAENPAENAAAPTMSEEELVSMQQDQYATALALKELKIAGCEGDGNCLFRTISHQLYGTQDQHPLIRAACVQYMRYHSEFFQQFTVYEDDFNGYLTQMSKLGTWGGEPEIQALSEIYNRGAEIYIYDTTDGCRVVKRLGSNDHNAFFHLSFHNSNHYDSLVSTCTGSQVGRLTTVAGEVEKEVLSRLSQAMAAAAAAAAASETTSALTHDVIVGGKETIEVLRDSGCWMQCTIERFTKVTLRPSRSKSEWRYAIQLVDGSKGQPIRNICLESLRKRVADVADVPANSMPEEEDMELHTVLLASRQQWEKDNAGKSLEDHWNDQQVKWKEQQQQQSPQTVDIGSLIDAQLARLTTELATSPLLPPAASFSWNRIGQSMTCTGAKEMYELHCSNEELRDAVLLQRKPKAHLFLHSFVQQCKGLRDIERHKLRLQQTTFQPTQPTKTAGWGAVLKQLAMDVVVKLLEQTMRDGSARYSVDGINKNVLLTTALTQIKKKHAASGLFANLERRTLEHWIETWHNAGKGQKGMDALGRRHGVGNNCAQLVPPALQLQIDRYILMILGAGIEVTRSLLRGFIIGHVCELDNGKWAPLVNPLDRAEQLEINKAVDADAASGGNTIATAVASASRTSMFGNSKVDGIRYMSFSTSWIGNQLKRLRKSWRTVTNNTGKLPPDALESLETAKIRMAYYISKYDIPREFVVNGDETPVMLIPRTGRTWTATNASNVPGQGKNDKRQCTFTPWVNAMGQTVATCSTVQGKTAGVQPSRIVQNKFVDHMFTQSENHWVSKETMRIQIQGKLYYTYTMLLVFGRLLVCVCVSLSFN